MRIRGEKGERDAFVERKVLVRFQRVAQQAL